MSPARSHRRSLMTWDTGSGHCWWRRVPAGIPGDSSAAAVPPSDAERWRCPREGRAATSPAVAATSPGRAALRIRGALPPPPQQEMGVALGKK